MIYLIQHPYDLLDMTTVAEVINSLGFDLYQGAIIYEKPGKKTRLRDALDKERQYLALLLQSTNQSKPEQWFSTYSETNRNKCV